MKAAVFVSQGMIWELKDGVPPDALGLLPSFWNVHDQRSAREQAEAAYDFGNGWDALQNFELKGRREDGYALQHPEDPPLQEMARAEMRDELIVLFEAEFVAIIQKDGSFRTQRMN